MPPRPRMASLLPLRSKNNAGIHRTWNVVLDFGYIPIVKQPQTHGHRIMKPGFVVFVIALLALPAAAQTQSSDRLQKVLAGGVLRVGTEYVKMTFGSMLADLAADRFDVAMSGMGRTLDRARVATFSKPYMRYGKLMMIRSADNGRFNSLADLDRPGIKIAYNKGGLNDRFANTMFKQAAATGFESNELATADLLCGKGDAQVSDSTAAIYMARKDSRIAAMSPDNIFNPVYVAMLLRRDDQTLLNYINIWIDQIEMDGTLAKIRTKWLGDTK